MNQQHEYTTILHLDSRHSVRVSDTDFYVPFTGLGTVSIKDAEGNPVGVPNGNLYPGEVFRDVTSVELHALRFESATDTLDVPYVIMDVNELNNNTFSNAPGANRTFAVIHTVHDTFVNKTIKFDYHDKVKYFRPSLSQLNRLTFKLKAPDNTSLQFNGFVSMIFRITHKKPL